MSTINAFGFLLVGSLMSFLPAIAPGYFPANSAHGANASALWLAIMGIFQGGLGAFYILRNEVLPLTVRLVSVRFRVPQFPTLPVRQRLRPITASAGRALRPSIAAYRHSTRSSVGQRLAA